VLNIHDWGPKQIHQFGENNNVSFGNDSFVKILGKDVVSLGSENVKEVNVLLVKDLKNNLLSVSKLCDQGYNLMLDSPICEIREEDLGRLVAKTTRISNIIYILDIKERMKIEATQKRSKDHKIGKDKKKKNKDEVLLRTISLAAVQKIRITLCH